LHPVEFISLVSSQAPFETMCCRRVKCTCLRRMVWSALINPYGAKPTGHGYRFRNSIERKIKQLYWFMIVFMNFEVCQR
ncbi:hypothetical protein KCU95_g94, partial [Aureobasidium melanogenum]